MNRINSIPGPLLRKIILTPLLGAVCMIFGLAMYLGAGDRTLLILSGVLLAMCVFKSIQYYHIASTRHYKTVCGTCVRITPQVAGRLRRVYLMDDLGVEITLRLPKQHRFTIGSRYRFYFAEVIGMNIGGEYLSALLAAGGFLGYEQIEGAGGIQADDDGSAPRP